MAYIVGKKQAGKTYYYLTESARVDGKPRIVSQRYLGSAEEVMARLGETGPGEVDRTRHLAFGDLAATWSMITRLGVVDIVDEVVGARRSDAAASVGTYIALAILNRVCDPCSKLAFADWWSTTAGDRLVRLPAAALDHRRFWDAMDTISETQLAEIERRIVVRTVATFGVDLSGLVLDMTNFATYIDSANPRAPIAQRGHAKQKRTDLRIVGLGLIVSTDGGIPLVSHAYAGNKPDVTQFPVLVDTLVSRFEALAGARDDLTLVFDAGQNSADNYELLDTAPLHFVGSLPPSDHPDLLAIAKSRYRSVDGFARLTAFETTKVVFGVSRRIILCMPLSPLPSTPGCHCETCRRPRRTPTRAPLCGTTGPGCHSTVTPPTSSPPSSPAPLAEHPAVWVRRGGAAVWVRRGGAAVWVRRGGAAPSFGVALLPAGRRQPIPQMGQYVRVQIEDCRAVLE